MTRPYFILGSVEDINKRSKSSTNHPQAGSDTTMHYFKGGREKLIDGKLYLIVPLSEIARYFELKVEDFLEEPMLDALSEIKRMRGYSPIINV